MHVHGRISMQCMQMTKQAETCGAAPGTVGTLRAYVRSLVRARTYVVVHGWWPWFASVCMPVLYGGGLVGQVS